ncbi:MAG: hypothetical protein SGBAC_006095 [Bacillariaceae sp.]
MTKTVICFTRRNRKSLSDLSLPWKSSRRRTHSLAAAMQFSSQSNSRATQETPKVSRVIPCHDSFNRIGQRELSRKSTKRSLASSAEVNNEERSERTIIEISKNGKLISITHDHLIVDGTFHAAWLWVNDPTYCHPSSGQRLRSLGDYDANTCTIVSAEVVVVSDEECDFLPSPPGSLHPKGGIYQAVQQEEDTKERLKVVWQSGEIAYYDLHWLGRFTASNDYSNSCRVTNNDAIGAIHEDNAGAFIPKFDYDEIMNSDNKSSFILFNVLGNIMEHGAVLIQNAGEDPNEEIVANLGRRICNTRLSHGSLYGDVFHVKSMPSAHNIAYTSEALPPHQDLTYYESKPFLQLLHCVQNAPLNEGGDNTGRGESILIDAMAAAEELRKLAPDLFETLCSVEATFCKQREGADMVSAKPHIVISTFDKSIVEINWSPPFEGPLFLPPTMDIKDQERLMDDYMVAYQAMKCLLDSHASTCSMLPPALGQELKDYAQRYTWEYALKEGEILVFNNQRMLHGRRSFSLLHDSKKQRHLIGCYTDAMDTLSHYGLLRRHKEKIEIRKNILTRIHGGEVLRWQFPIKNPGNGTRAILLRR